MISSALIFTLFQCTFILTLNWLSYRCSFETVSLPEEQGRTLRPEDASWDDDAVPDLKTLALRVIVSIWKDYPILKALPTCVDKDMLLEMLPTDLPFELVIRKIEDGIYWERAAKDRWENIRPVIFYCEKCHCVISTCASNMRNICSTVNCC